MMLEAYDLVKYFGPVRALGGCSFSCQPGEVTALLGPNGSGKSTLMSIIVGLQRACEGMIAWDGKLLSQRRSPVERSLFGYAPQEIALYPKLTATENLRYLHRIFSRGHAKEDTYRRAERIFGVNEFRDRPVHTLSGGQQRRVHAAAALLGNPRVVLLDEPSAGMDAASREALLSGVAEVAKDGVAVLYSTHYIHEVEDQKMRLLVLRDGVVVGEGSPSELLSRHPFVLNLRFREQVPDLGSFPLPGAVLKGDGRISVEITGSEVTVASALRRLGTSADDVVQAEMCIPRVDDIYRELVGI